MIMWDSGRQTGPRPKFGAIDTFYWVVHSLPLWPAICVEAKTIDLTIKRFFNTVLQKKWSSHLN